MLFVVLWNVYGPGGANGAALPLLAAAGGLLAGATVYLLCRAGGGNPLRVTLTGVLVGAMLTSASSLLLLLHPTQIGAVLLFTIGSLDGLTWLHWSTIWPWALVALPLGLASAGFANTLQLGDDISAGLGMGVGRARVGLLAVAVALTAGAVSVVGAIGFLGLVAPHMARPFAGADCRRLFPLSALFGMLLLLAANLPSRLITSPTLPVGVTVAIIGAPLFAVLLVRSRHGCADPRDPPRRRSRAHVRGRDVLSDVNLAFATAGITAVVGPNGAGKSTLLKALARLVTPIGGRCTSTAGR